MNLARTNPLSIRSMTALKVAGGVALLATAAGLVYKATRPALVAPGPMLQAGSQTLVVQAPAGTTAAVLQGELAQVLGPTQALPFTSIPLALEDPNAATLWSLTVVLTGATSLSALNSLFGPIGVWFLGTTAPALTWTANTSTVTAGKAAKLTIATTGNPSVADVTAYLTAQGLTNLTGSLTPSGSAWTATATSANTGALNDLTVTYNGATQTYAVESATATQGLGSVGWDYPAAAVTQSIPGASGYGVHVFPEPTATPAVPTQSPGPAAPTQSPSTGPAAPTQTSLVPGKWYELGSQFILTETLQALASATPGDIPSSVLTILKSSHQPLAIQILASLRTRQPTRWVSVYGQVLENGVTGPVSGVVGAFVQYGKPLGYMFALQALPETLYGATTSPTGPTQQAAAQAMYAALAAHGYCQSDVPIYRAFQTSMGLVADGYPGTNTINALSQIIGHPPAGPGGYRAPHLSVGRISRLDHR